MGRPSHEKIRRDYAVYERRKTALELAAIAVDKDVPPEVRRGAVQILSWLAERK